MLWGQNVHPLNTMYKDNTKSHLIVSHMCLQYRLIIIIVVVVVNLPQTHLHKGELLGYVTGQSRGWVGIR